METSPSVFKENNVNLAGENGVETRTRHLCSSGAKAANSFKTPEYIQVLGAKTCTACSDKKKDAIDILVTDQWRYHRGL